jgi:glucose-1-phosphate adenylyltransferase
MYPDHLYTGISLVGKETDIPAGTVVGRNCIINPWTRQEDFSEKVLKDGDTI